MPELPQNLKIWPGPPYPPLNEVGGDAAALGSSLGEFHTYSALRNRHPPRGTAVSGQRHDVANDYPVDGLMRTGAGCLRLGRMLTGHTARLLADIPRAE